MPPTPGPFFFFFNCFLCRVQNNAFHPALFVHTWRGTLLHPLLPRCSPLWLLFTSYWFLSAQIVPVSVLPCVYIQLKPIVHVRENVIFCLCLITLFCPPSLPLNLFLTTHSPCSYSHVLCVFCSVPIPHMRENTECFPLCFWLIS